MSISAVEKVIFDAHSCVIKCCCCTLWKYCIV